jgi:hypothetical protein
LLSEKYDSEPLIHEVAVTSCMSFTAEPFFLPNEPSVARALNAAEFQTYHETPPDFDATIRLAVSLGAGSVELWQDYKGFPLVPDAKLKQWAAMLEK